MRTALAFSALLFASPAMAQTYCGAATHNNRFYDGGTFERQWTVTKESARVPRNPGSTRARPWCSWDVFTLGAQYLPPDVIQKPRLGQVNARRGRISYRSNTVGVDTFTVRLHWIDGMKKASAVITYRMNVIDRAL